MRHPSPIDSRLTRHACVLLLPLLYSAAADADIVYSNLPTYYHPTCQLRLSGHEHH